MIESGETTGPRHAAAGRDGGSADLAGPTRGARDGPAAEHIFRDVKASIFHRQPGRVDRPSVDEATLVCYVGQGSATTYTGHIGEVAVDGAYAYGHMSLIPPGTPIAVAWDSDPKVAHLRFRPTFIEEKLVDELALRPQDARLQPTAHFNDPFILAVAEAMVDELAQECPGQSLFVDGLGLALGVHLLRHYARSPDRGRVASRVGRRALAKPSPMVARSLEFMEANLGRDLSLAEIAEAAGQSAYHFVRTFRSVMGTTPYRYVIRRRIERAKTLLRTSDEPVAQIGLACGFASQPHFTTAFKRETGVTPAAYRGKLEQQDTGPSGGDRRPATAR